MASPKAYVLSEQAARWVSAQARAVEGSEQLPEQTQFNDAPLKRVYVRNMSGETIPPHGIMRVSGYTADQSGKIIVNVQKPSTVLGSFLVNGPFEIADGKIGIGLDTNPVIVAYDSGFTFSASDNYGVDGWLLQPIPKGKPLLNIKGLADYDATKRFCIALVQPLERIMFQAPSGGLPGRVGVNEQGETCSLVTNRTDNDALVVSAVQAKVVNWTTQTVCATGDRYGIAIWVDGRWKVIAEDCDSDGSTVPPGSGTGTFADPKNPIDPLVPGLVATSVFSNVSFSGSATPDYD